MKLTEHEIEVMLEEAEMVELRPYDGTYNGRYNVVCEHAIVGSKKCYKQLVLNVVRVAVDVAIDGEYNMAESYKNIAQWLIKARCDNLGKDYIWY